MDDAAVVSVRRVSPTKVVAACEHLVREGALAVAAQSRLAAQRLDAPQGQRHLGTLGLRQKIAVGVLREARDKAGELAERLPSRHGVGGAEDQPGARSLLRDPPAVQQARCHWDQRLHTVLSVLRVVAPGLRDQPHLPAPVALICPRNLCPIVLGRAINTDPLPALGSYLALAQPLHDAAAESDPVHERQMRTVHQLLEVVPWNAAPSLAVSAIEDAIAVGLRQRVDPTSTSLDGFGADATGGFISRAWQLDFSRWIRRDELRRAILRSIEAAADK